jgi:hypothetical protein
MRLRSVVLLCCAVLAGLAWLAAGSLWADAPPPPADEPEATVSADEPEEVGVAASVAEAGFAAENSTDGGDDDEALREAADPATQARGLQVQVVHGNPATPVAGASVFFVTEAEARARMPDADRIPRAAWPGRVGRRIETDAEGRAILPAERAGLLISAEHERLFAFAQVERWQRLTVLTLFADETLHVRVSNVDGKAAAGVPFALLVRKNAGDNDPQAFWRGSTGPDGLAEVPHFQELRPSRAERDEQFWALLKVPTIDPIATQFAGRPAQSEPVALVAPPLGSASVRVLDRSGTPILSRADLWITANGRPAQGAFPAPRGETGVRIAKPLGDKPVPMAGIPVQAPIRASANFRYDWGRPSRLEALGPPDPGAEQALELRLDGAKAVIAGRLTTADGQPFGNAKAAVIAWRGDRALFELEVETIADGRFDLVVEPQGGQPSDWLDFRVLGAAPTDSQLAAEVLGVRAQVGTLAAGDRRELGTLVLRPLPPLAMGFVRDDTGQPLANANVRLQTLIRERDRDEWRDLPGSRVGSSTDGTFAMFGERPPGQLRLYADRDGHFGADGPMLPPGQATALELPRHGVLVGRVLLPSWVGDGMMELALEPTDPSLDERTKRAQTVRTQLRRSRGGRFWLAPLRKGTYDAKITMRSLVDPVLTIAGVYAEPGTNRDGRFARIDLTAAIHRYRLRAADETGRMMALSAPLLVRTRRPDGTLVTAGFRFDRGRAEILAPEPSLEFVAFAAGCAPTIVTLPAGEHVITLQSQQPALLRLPNVRALCGPERKVRVSVIFAGETGYPEWLNAVDQRSGERFQFPRWELGKSGGAWLESSDTVEVPLALEGAYEVVLRVHATGSTDSPQASLPLGKHDLRFAGMRSVLDIPVDQDKLLEMLRQLDQRRLADEQRRQASQNAPSRGSNGSRNR